MKGSTEGRGGSPEALAAFLKERLAGLAWTQKRLANEAGKSDTAISELLLQQTGLTPEMAEALAAIPELQTTAEELLRIAGKLRSRAAPAGDIPAKRAERNEVARRLIESLTDEDLVIATDLLITLKRRKTKR